MLFMVARLHRTTEKLLEEWIANWSDIVEFEVFPVVTSEEAVRRITPKL